MRKNAMSVFPTTAAITPITPHRRFIRVMVLGMCFLMLIYLRPIFLRISLGTAFLFTIMLRVLPFTNSSDMYQMPL